MATSQATGKTGVTPVKAGAPDSSGLTIRQCDTLAEMQAAFALQKEVWAFSDADLIPVRMFVVASKIGGHVIGAFDGEEMVAFALAIPGMRNGHSYLHSHMVGVRQGYRNAGLGRKMKLHQRDAALARGIDLMEWTFDPLEIKNGYLNIEKLGAITRRYNVNQYGITSSPLQGSLPTDRLIAEWWMKSRRVSEVLSSGHHPMLEPKLRIDVPGEIYEWKAAPATRSRALEVQSKNREQFTQAFGGGLSVLGYERNERGDGTFLLGIWDEPWKY